MGNRLEITSPRRMREIGKRKREKEDEFGLRGKFKETGRLVV